MPPSAARLLALIVGAACLPWPAAAQPRAPFVFDPSGAVAAERSYMWSDGQDLLLVNSGDRVFELRRGQPAVVHQLSPWQSKPKSYVNSGLSGSGSGAHAVVLVWDEEGHLEWRTAAGWQRAQCPLHEDGLLRATADERGRAYCTYGTTLAVYENDKWSQFPLPADSRGAAELWATADGVLLALHKGRLLRFADGQFSERSFPTLPQELRSYLWNETYYSAATDTLWVIANQSGDYYKTWEHQALLALRVSTGEVTVHPLARASRTLLYANRLRGASDRGGTRLAMCDLRTLVFFDGTGLSEVKDWEGGHFHLEIPESLRVDMALVWTPGDQAVYYVDGLTLHRVPLVEPEAQQQQRIAVQKKANRPLVFPVLHAALGPVWHLTPTSTDAALAVDVDVGAAVLFNRSSKRALVALLPQLSYSYDRTEQLGGHFLSLGLGAAVGRLGISGAYTPRFVIEAGGASRLGFRHGLAVYLLATLLTIELSHEALVADGAVQHDVRLMFGLSPGPLLVGALFLSLSRKVFGR